MPLARPETLAWKAVASRAATAVGVPGGAVTANARNWPWRTKGRTDLSPKSRSP